MSGGKFSKETKYLRGLINAQPRVWYSNHAKRRMRERGIDKLDVLSILKKGQVIENQSNAPDVHILKIEGQSIDGRRCQVPVQIREGELEIGVITVVDKTQ